MLCILKEEERVQSVIFIALLCDSVYISRDIECFTVSNVVSME